MADQPGVNRQGGAPGSHAFQRWRHAMLSQCIVSICLVESDRLKCLGLAGISDSGCNQLWSEVLSQCSRNPIGTRHAGQASQGLEIGLAERRSTHALGLGRVAALTMDINSTTEEHWFILVEIIPSYWAN